MTGRRNESSLRALLDWADLGEGERLSDLMDDFEQRAIVTDELVALVPQEISPCLIFDASWD
ncbi:MAG: hypothetical protein CL467_03085 [Acidimicrobiaceae bacterium]|nr:hypothetical protein [Acidimicrobiaceae bacterium]HAQ24089.1 hypothetical protein [Acidimicrobiaceae bacterium]|tara:strand:- start:9174 stop:9359 length:186 start_codon:yes stop_codon:yes gene_type:complete